MSFFVGLASDMPLEAMPNPHIVMLSVNEALEQGIEVPKAMLMDYEIDHDEPGMILWSDIEPNIDIEKGIFELPDHRRYTISMFTKDMESDQEGMALIAEVSKAVYLAMK